MTDPSHPTPSTRDEVFEAYAPLAESLARRYSSHGEPMEDLVQVAYMALVNAIDRFDPERGVRFTAFAIPTIVGELKRYFRDRGWAVRMPRRLQENALKLRKIIDPLTQSVGRPPTVAEIAEATGMTEEEVIEATEAARAYSTASLDAPFGEQAVLGETIASPEDDIQIAEDLVDIVAVIQRLPERERRIVHMRFFQGLTQSEIAIQIGVSQMHVSRLLSGALEALRNELTTAGEP